MNRLFYTILIYFLLPIARLRLHWRGRKEAGYKQHIAERFGYYKLIYDRPLIWIHAVSVGETRATLPIVSALQEIYPNKKILITHSTPTGRATSESLWGDKVLRCYLPYDYPAAVKRFLHYFKPELALIMETEIWPNLIHYSQKNNIPIWLVNARMSAKSAKGYSHFGKLIKQSLQKFNGICAQTEADADRLKPLGAEKVKVCGNIKFDIAPPREMLMLGQEWRESIGITRPVFLVASTREGEEELILDALKSNHQPNVLTIIVPRHPQRFAEVETLIRTKGFSMQKRSDNQVIADETSILLGDSMGEMFAYYAACDVAFIGGSLLPLGGQNLIEACAVGKPVLIGPYTFNFAEATEQAIANGTARRIENAGMLIQVAHQLLSDAKSRQDMGGKGLAFSNAHKGAVTKILNEISSQAL